MEGVSLTSTQHNRDRSFSRLCVPLVFKKTGGSTGGQMSHLRSNNSRHFGGSPVVQKAHRYTPRPAKVGLARLGMATSGSTPG